MKEVLTKKFWQDVKKTFEEARDGAALKADGPELHPGDDSPAEVPPLEDFNKTADIREGA